MNQEVLKLYKEAQESHEAREALENLMRTKYQSPNIRKRRENPEDEEK